MLYSKTIKLDKERTLKIGMRETIKLLDKGINVFEFSNDFNTIMTILLIGLQKEDKDLTMDKLIDIFDECDLPYHTLYETILEAISFGLGKEDNLLDKKSEDNNEEKNS